MAIRRRGGTTKNPPILSHEFIIQNHADIVSCLAMLILVGLMFQVTSPLSSVFVTMQYNITTNVSADPESDSEEVEEVTSYSHGPKDICSVFFYLLIAVVLHAVVQEYVLDKLNRKLHLSKTKHSKFNESGQLLAFYIFSIAWAVDIMMKEGFLNNLSHLWDGYPHTLLSFRLKFYFVTQIAYWLHSFPELYFQKIKREEMGDRIKFAAFYLAFIVSAYVINLTRLAILCLVLHYLAEMTFHLARILYFSDYLDYSKPCFKLWFVTFLAARVCIVSLTILTVWFGLGRLPNQGFDLATGNFNTAFFRIVILAAVCLFQAWVLFDFLTFQLRRRTEQLASQAGQPKKKGPHSTPTSPKKDRTRKEEGKVSNHDSPQNGGVRTRSKSKKK
ncbi:Translocating chain-associated membrane protein 1-like 1 [Holothuria leucospilota]|uniref:Translocating chain-associated membrane protein 1-like 1 n=1 Tax=Holothuria leucospilota TaxID=206669 RepID=A0A9Q0YH67_HOLLE|nr:Translocating chain-associated membrane protein 1-like 1 [Holothuria leucospilota]